ncbi:uncharacterized protein LOC123549838 [Mercenaria mercenaria]|uniref:uncharacterized protein LOC123549838 n=1 Tax=Mercenaria mercenaria TaxID=6596 RepID=UPI00234E6BA8|nr:uncharacterized protein LOC123549838 [Mercenaria mercenaria]XP_053402620.1 uncharacterized protein LOC123549838 [Mercenaria mercenaria]
MTTKLEIQEELRKKQFQARVMHERRRSSLGAETAYDAERISKEQEKLRKQHERLENAKTHHKKHSFLTKDRRLSLTDDKLPDVLTPSTTPDIQSKSAHSPDYTKTKSRLFDYERLASPRGRRQLMTSAEGSPVQSPLPPRTIAPKSSHAMEARKTSHTDTVKKIARVPHGSTAELGKKPSSRQSLHSENKVRFKEDHMPASPSSNERTRRGSLPTSFPSPFPQKRRASLPASGFEPVKPPSRQRRHSMPANTNLLPKIIVDEAPNLSPDLDEQETRLTALYNKAIQTVQLADETLLAANIKYLDRPNMHRLSLGSPSDKISGSGFGLATLKELESILSDARVYSNRKGSRKEYSCLDGATKRAQKKRIEHLEQVLKKLNPTYDTSVDIDPLKVLQCSYLRLSKSNVETLEKMSREQGKDSGIHIHMDVTDYDIWKNLKEERTDLKKPEPEVDEIHSPRKQKILHT